MLHVVRYLRDLALYREEKKAVADAALDGGDAKQLNKLSTKGASLRVTGEK